MSLESKRIMGLRGENDAVIEAVRELQEPWVLEIEGHGVKTQIAVVGGNVVPLADIFEAERKRRAEPPLRTKGTAKAETLESFCDLVKYHAHDDTRIFAATTPSKGGPWPELTAIVDYHGEAGESGPGDSGCCEHRITYCFPRSESLIAWAVSGSTWQAQRAFAEWLNGRRFDLAYPDQIDAPTEDSMVWKVMRALAPEIAADKLTPGLIYADAHKILSLIQGLSARVSSDYAEETPSRWSTKVRFEKDKQVVSNAPSEIPNWFLVSIAPFPGEEALTLPVRLDVRITEAGGLELRCVLIGLERVVEAAFVAALEKVEKATGIKPFRGNPEV